MTYILGSRCKDGVVLIADTKITIDNGRRYEYEDKLITEFRDLLSVVIGFSGDKEPFTEFRMRLRPRVSELEEEFRKKNKISTDKINLMIIEITRSLKTHYNQLVYDVIAGMSSI
jgi:20S proteasome alpha/beta subunit